MVHLINLRQFCSVFGQMINNMMIHLERFKIGVTTNLCIPEIKYIYFFLTHFRFCEAEAK